MINNDRIVPVTKTDLISLYALILKQNSSNYSMTALAADNVDGDFTCEANGTYIADQPLKSFDFGDTTSTVVYFVAAYNFAGFTKSGAVMPITADSVAVQPDGVTLYKAMIDNLTDVKIQKVGL